LALVSRGWVPIRLNLADDIDAVRASFERCANVPLPLARACLIRPSAQHEPAARRHNAARLRASAAAPALSLATSHPNLHHAK
jgi:hypothetical protein